MDTWKKWTALLGWCALVNYALLLLWFVVVTCAGDWYFDMHRAFGINLTNEVLEALHFSLMGGMKMLFIVFNLVPFLVLLALGRAWRKAQA